MTTCSIHYGFENLILEWEYESEVADLFQGQLIIAQNDSQTYLPQLTSAYAEASVNLEVKKKVLNFASPKLGKMFSVIWNWILTNRVRIGEVDSNLKSY